MKVKMMRLMIIVERLKRIPADDDAHGRKDDDKPLGKVVNVPKLVKDYKSLKPKKVKHPFFDFIDAQEGKK